MGQQWNNGNHSTPTPNQDWNNLEEHLFGVFFLSFLFFLFRFCSVVRQIQSNRISTLWQIKSIKWFQIRRKIISEIHERHKHLK